MTDLGRVLYVGLGLPYPGRGMELRSDHNELTKKADRDDDGFARTEELFEEVFSDRQGYFSVIEELHRAGLEDPFEEKEEIKAYVKKLFHQHAPSNDMNKAILLLRAVIYQKKEFKVCESNCEFVSRTRIDFHTDIYYSGLRVGEGGLVVSHNDDFSAPLRQRHGDLLPKELMDAKRGSRIAHCLEYSFLLIALLRAAGIRAHFKSAGEHAYVIAEIEGKKYMLDAVNLIFQLTDEEPDTDYHGVIAHYVNERHARSRQGKEEEALAVRRRLLELAPSDAARWNNLGVLYARRGEGKKALLAFERALVLEPKNARIRRNRQRVLSILKE